MKIQELFENTSNDFYAELSFTIECENRNRDVKSRKEEQNFSYNTLERLNEIINNDDFVIKSLGQ